MDDDPDPDGAPRPSPDAPPLAIDVVEEAGDWTALGDVAARVEPIAAAISRHVEIDERSEVALALSDDAHVRTLNATWRGKDRPTNVLSFPAADMVRPDGVAMPLGDVIVALETLTREAAEQDIPIGHHFDHLVVHGVLHLLGYDHEDAAEAEEMEALEVAILADMGVPDPYVGSVLED